ncbi:MAG TPA: hypothetical protein VG276_29660 [Actinomycetes bacterium]|nr:hypothetical protein [Actinomycetes bacterium]
MKSVRVDPGAEVVDLVDTQDRVVGRALRRDVRRDKLLHRGVAVLCRNQAGEIYVHRRTDTKDVFPTLHAHLNTRVADQAWSLHQVAGELGLGRRVARGDLTPGLPQNGT